MSNAKEFDKLAALSEANTSRVRSRGGFIVAGVRVSPGPYFALGSVITFFSALLLRTQHDAWALTLLLIAWLLVPLLALTDRVVFDGESIRRQGPLFGLLNKVLGYRKSLGISDIETVETNAVRTLRRGGSVRYRYRTQIDGKGRHFAFASGGKGYRRFVREVFPLIHQDKLDARSRDLRDYLNDPRFVNQKTRLSQLASTEILDGVKEGSLLGGKNARRSDIDVGPASPQDLERAHLLRRLGNELKVSGRLREAGEAFRRALNVTPRGAWLIYDFARLLRSQASAQADARLLNRARAALRLACMRAENDLVLLPLIGESFLECGDSRQARQVLQKAVDLDTGNFKARLGLADIALSEGKLAHVIHHYHEAARVTAESALERYARREADYYLMLNNDDDYLSNELRRISWLQNVTRVRRLAIRVTNAGILVALLGSYVDPVMSGMGWSVASSSLIIWMVTVGAARVLLNRSKPRSLA